jgi:DNA processing protein
LAFVRALGDPLSVLAAEDAALFQVPEIKPLHVTRLRAAQATVDLIRRRTQVAESGLQVVGWDSPLYPPLLREAPDPPAMLFVQGSLERRDELAVAVVGTRKCTPYGVRAARDLATNLSLRGFTVVSGLALGIDGEAHQAVCEAGGRTIAVLPCGPDVTYPPRHRALRAAVAEHGAVVTEYGFGTEPMRERFPARNRIIAGLARGTVVIEAPDKSGAMITARQATEAGRDVFAVPGPVYSPHSRGCHALIKDGAGLVETVEDIIDGLGIRLDAVPARPKRDTSALPESERAVLGALSHEPAHVDNIVAGTGLSTAQVTSALMLLEVKTLVRRFPGSTYVRTD